MSTVSRAEVADIIVYDENIREYILKVDMYEHFEPGQFLQLTLDSVTASQNWPESRTFSIASYLNDEKTIRLVIKRTGNYTTRLFDELKVGGSCYIKYAYGDFLLPMFDEDNRIHCIAGGTGIAPFLSFMEYLEKEGRLDRLFIYYSARTATGFVNSKAIRKHLNSQALFYCTREETVDALCKRIEIQDVLANVNDITEEHFYICGSNEFISSFKNELASRGAGNIYLDEWN